MHLGNQLILVYNTIGYVDPGQLQDIFIANQVLFRAARYIARSQIASTTAHGAPRSPWEQPCHYLKLCGLAFQSGSKPSHGPPQFPATEAHGSPRKPHLWPTEAHGNPNSQQWKAKLWPTEAPIVAHGSPRKPTESPIPAGFFANLFGNCGPRKPTETGGSPAAKLPSMALQWPYNFAREVSRSGFSWALHGPAWETAELYYILAIYLAVLSKVSCGWIAKRSHLHRSY